MGRAFSLSKEDRDRLFCEKDDATVPLIRKVTIPFPRLFKAVLMPALYGPEVFYLRSKGVPGENLFAVERDARIHSVLLSQPEDLPHLSGIVTTPIAMRLDHAVEHIPYRDVGLIYLDLYGQLDHHTLGAMTRMLTRCRVTDGGSILLTHGRNRGDAFSCRVNKRLSTSTPGRAYLATALESSGHRSPVSTKDHEYISKNINFYITEARF